MTKRWDYFEQSVMPIILDNETTCRMFLDGLIARGVQLSVPAETLTHEEAARACRHVFEELKARENLQ